MTVHHVLLGTERIRRLLFLLQGCDRNADAIGRGSWNWDTAELVGWTRENMWLYASVREALGRSCAVLYAQMDEST